MCMQVSSAEKDCLLGEEILCVQSHCRGLSQDKVRKFDKVGFQFSDWYGVSLGRLSFFFFFLAGDKLVKMRSDPESLCSLVDFQPLCWDCKVGFLKNETPYSITYVNGFPSVRILLHCQSSDILHQEVILQSF